MNKKNGSGSGVKVITTNRKARHNFELLTAYQAGIVLMGSEIKSIRANRVSLGEAFVQEQNGELWLMNAHIATYDPAKTFGHSDPIRPRKLLLHRKEINQIITSIREVSYTAVPTKLYLERGLAKIELAVARGKKQYDKRQTLAKRDSELRIKRAMNERNSS